MTNIKQKENKLLNEYKSLILSGSIFIIVIGILGVITYNTNPQIDLISEDVIVQEGEIYSIDYKISGLNKEQLIWKSNNDDIATVTSDGKVQGKIEGETIIYVSDDKNIKEKLTVVVTKKQQESAVKENVEKIEEYTCDEGWTQKGKKCYLYTIKEGDKCPVEWDESSNGMCFKEAEATLGYTCPDGYLYTDNGCIASN